MEINGNPVAYGIGKTGNLAGKLTVKALAEKVKQAFDLPFVLVYGEELMDMEIEKVALCPGAGGSVIEEAIHEMCIRDRNCYVLCTPAILKIYICHKITTIGIHIYIARCV